MAYKIRIANESGSGKGSENLANAHAAQRSPVGGIHGSESPSNRARSGFPVGYDDASLFIIDELFLKRLCGGNHVCLKELMAMVEKSILSYAVERAHGNKKKAALLLGINYTTLYMKIKKYRMLADANEEITLF